MKIYLHYTIWNKQGHVPWICEGIRMTIPKDSIIDFVFDNPTDDGVKQLEAQIDLLESSYGSLKGFKVIYRISKKKLRWPNTNDAIERFMKSDCSLFLSPQDDMKIQDKKIVPNLIKLYQENTNVGMIGMRDGITNGKFWSSNHSPGGGPLTTFLKSGEYMPVWFVNDGPVCLSKFTIDTVGLFDLEYWAHFGDNDYCWRAEEKGLQNFVMGAEIVHEKFSAQASEVWNQDYSIHDYEVYKRKWPHKL